MSTSRLLRLSFALLLLAPASCRQGEPPLNRNQQAPARDSISKAQPNHPCVNINTASAEELMALPGIGEAASRKIIEHRERNGRFRRPEEIIIVDGFSERKYRALATLICVE